jgi:hypothetical protein
MQRRQGKLAPIAIAVVTEKATGLIPDRSSASRNRFLTAPHGHVPVEVYSSTKPSSHETGAGYQSANIPQDPKIFLIYQGVGPFVSCTTIL